MKSPCESCKHARWSRYYPQTHDSPEECPEVTGCTLSSVKPDPEDVDECDDWAEAWHQTATDNYWLNRGL